ncbi:hypothetical protein OY671_011254, partial [Metschnikowia pulcherrima]
MLVKIDSGQQCNQFGRLMDINAMLLGALNDLFGNQAFSFGHHPGGCIGLAIGEGDCLA